MFLKFGIPSLDELVEIPHPVESVTPGIASETVAILGPEGAGKSVLALHLASRYAADCLRRVYPTDSTQAKPKKSILPRILYISSDLKASSAERVWKNFALEHPNTRQIPFERNMAGVERYTSIHRKHTLELKKLWLGADTTDELVRELLIPARHRKKDNNANVIFLDLASHTAGDDWSLVNALLVKLQTVDSARFSKKKPALPHLVIIDSVAGFETFVGRIDAYGNEQSRRSRIAQCLRNAGERVSLVFVVEESTGAERLPEEYVTDVVLSLRKKTVCQNSVLTVEVQKARAREHAKGEHSFEIRDRVSARASATLCGNQCSFQEVAHFPKFLKSFISGIRRAFTSQIVVCSKSPLQSMPSSPLAVAGPAENPSKPLLKRPAQAIVILNSASKQPFKLRVLLDLTQFA